MITINYTKKGLPYKDFEVEELLKTLLEKKENLTLDVATENIIYMARTLIAEGKIITNDIIFKYEGQLEIKCLKMGKLVCDKEIPQDFCFTENCLDRMLGLL